MPGFPKAHHDPQRIFDAGCIQPIQLLAGFCPDMTIDKGRCSLGSTVHPHGKGIRALLFQLPTDLGFHITDRCISGYGLHRGLCLRISSAIPISISADRLNGSPLTRKQRQHGHCLAAKPGWGG